MAEWQSSAAYTPGDKVQLLVARGWLDIWIERVTTFRWAVATHECREFTVI